MTINMSRIVQTLILVTLYVFLYAPILYVVYVSFQ